MQEQTAEENKENKEEKERDGEIRGHLCLGGAPPFQRKTLTSQDSTQNMRTCCCRESMKTSHIKTTGRTCMGE